jgi:hypothetical protein
VCRVGGDEELSLLLGALGRTHEERQCSIAVAVRVPQPSALEVDADAGARARAGERLRLAQALLAALELAAQAVDAGELGEELRAHAFVLFGVQPLFEARLARVEVAEVPERSQLVLHAVPPLPRGTKA